MSSAILYLAIVAIWACVLIPRWLRRDSARGAAVPVAAEPPAPAEAEAAGDAPSPEGDEEAEPVQAPAWAVKRLSAVESRRRMLTARRRLLVMLIGLEAAALALAFAGLAAVWVVVPPSLMLLGYLLLLREAAQADAEQVQYEAEAAVRAREQARIRAEARQAPPAEDTPAEDVEDVAAALAAKFAAAPVPADYDDSAPGRDYAPGLAGKYTTSNADTESADEDYYEAYEAQRLRRAVGD